MIESLYTEHYPMVRQMCTGFMKGDSAAASDLTQDVFVNVVNALPRFKGESSHKTWIYRITVNTCLQFLRREKKLGKISPEHAPDVADESNEATERMNELYNAIGQLQEVDRLIIMMVLDELSYEEIANVVGVEPGNLRVKIHRIKKRLKEILDNGK